MEVKNFFKGNYILIIILIFAFVSGVIFSNVTPVKYWDETIYLSLGYDLSKDPLEYTFSHGWSDFIPRSENYIDQAGFRAPLLPYTLALLYLINVDWFIDLLMPLISALAVLITFYMGNKMFNKEIGIMAASFLAFMPMFAFYSGKVLADIYSTFFILIALLFFWKGFYEKEDRSKIIFGILFALAVLSKYSNLWLIPFFALFQIYKNKSLSFIKDKYIYILFNNCILCNYISVINLRIF